MTALRVHFVSMLLLAFIVSSVLPFSTRAVSNQEAAAAVSEAKQAIAAGFEDTLDAEKAGANVSGLLVKLNEGGDFLSAAQMAFEDGNYDEATRLSALSSEVGAQVQSDALTLKVEASNAAVTRFRLYLISSAVAMVIIVIATIFGYRFLRKRYSASTEMKPEAKEA